MNGVGVIGRIVPTIIVDRTGVFNLLIPCAIACGVLIFSWIAMKDAAAFIVMAVLFGFFSGAGAYQCVLRSLQFAQVLNKIVISLFGPMIAHLTTDVSEIGYVNLTTGYRVFKV